MNQSETRTLWISIGAALLAVFVLYSYTQEKAAELNKKFGAKRSVVMASRDILEMQTIDESMLQMVERPVSFIPPGAVSEVESLVGLISLVPMQKGEILLENKVIDPGPITGLAIQVAPGKRAITLPIDEVRGVGKLLKPGDRVDIVSAFDVGKGFNQKKEIRTIMQDVIILSTGLRVVNDVPRLYEKKGNQEFFRNLKSNTEFGNITIEASPHEAQNLIYILSTSPGSLFLTLRHPSDRTRLNLPSTNQDSVRGQVNRSFLKGKMRNSSENFNSKYKKDKGYESLDEEFNFFEKPPQPLISKNPIDKKFHL